MTLMNLRVEEPIKKGHGTLSDRPPIIGTVERESKRIQIEVRHSTDKTILTKQIKAFTVPESICNTDEWRGYNDISRTIVKTKQCAML
ncbi:MAG: transposase [Ignavibacteriae bacterium]|nr:transposase [Ignavibacteriota bacterium]